MKIKFEIVWKIKKVRDKGDRVWEEVKKGKMENYYFWLGEKLRDLYF